MIWAFDLDGVLAVGPSQPTKSWRRMSGVERTAHVEQTESNYAKAAVLHTPTVVRFHVITARKHTTRAVTTAWLQKHFPDQVVALHMLEEGRTIENVVRFKASILDRYRVTDYAEDNRAVVRALRKRVSMCRVWHFVRGGLKLDYEAPL